MRESVRENGVDSPYFFLNPGYRMVASLAHTKEFFKKTKRSRSYIRENRVDSPYLFLHCVFSSVCSPRLRCRDG